MTRTIGVMVAALALAAGCGGGEDSGGAEGQADADVGELVESLDEAAPCAEMFAPGRPVADVVADVEEIGLCSTGPDDVTITVWTSSTCPDGTTVADFGEFGWGLEQDGAVLQPAGSPLPC